MSFKQSLFGTVPDDWKVSKIGDIADLRQGLQISKKLRLELPVSGSVPLLKITDLPSKIFTEFVKNIPENYIATKDDIIYTRTGQVGLVYTDVVGCVHNNCFKVIFDYNKFDKYYVYYYLNSKQVRNYSNAVASGSVQKDLTHTAFKKCLFAYPSLKKQKAIANILSTLDEKIETNNQINKKLEEMAQVIFKQWFVDFEFPNEDGEPYKSSGGEMVESELGMIPKEWKVSNLKDIIDFNPKESLNKDTEYKFIEMAALSNFACDIKYWITKKFSSGSKFRNGDTLLARITPCLENGKTAFVDVLEENEVAFGSTEFIVMREREISNKYYLYCLARDSSFRAYAIKSMSGSSGRQRVQLDLLKNYKIAQAPKYIYDRYGKILDSLFENISNNNREIKKLIKLKDTLLPKLMSGEIRVPLDSNEN